MDMVVGVIVGCDVQVIGIMQDLNIELDIGRVGGHKDQLLLKPQVSHKSAVPSILASMFYACGSTSKINRSL